MPVPIRTTNTPRSTRRGVTGRLRLNARPALALTRRTGTTAGIPGHDRRSPAQITTGGAAGGRGGSPGQNK